MLVRNRSSPVTGTPFLNNSPIEDLELAHPPCSIPSCACMFESQLQEIIAAVTWASAPPSKLSLCHGRARRSVWAHFPALNIEVFLSSQGLEMAIVLNWQSLKTTFVPILNDYDVIEPRLCKSIKHVCIIRYQIVKIR